MKILKLNFKNIHSLKGQHCIDFSKYPLADSGIFAIIGPTGSGKSTLLDIITLALYNRTPRIGTLSKNAVKSYGSIITRNTDDCFAEIEYNIKDKIYRSKWEISIARTGELRDYEMELSDITEKNEGKILSSKKGEIPVLNSEIIGLNYEQFIKSIVLSQGDFAKFLKATPDERGDLLEKITGTEIYRRIGKAAFEKQKEEKIKLDFLKVKIESINLLSDEEILQFTDFLYNEEEFIKTTNLELEKFSKLFALKKNIGNLEQRSNEFKIQFQKVENEIKNFEPELLKLQKHEKLLFLKSDIFDLKNNISAQNTLKEKIIIANKNFTEITEKLKISTELLNKLNSEKEKLDKEFEALLPKIKKARELDISINNLENKRKEIHELFQKKSTSYKTDNLKKEELEKLIEKEKSDLKNSENWLSENIILENLLQEFSLIKEKIQNYTQENKATELVIIKITDKKLLSELSKSSTWEGKINNIHSYIHNIKSVENELKNKIIFNKLTKDELETKRDKLRNLLEILNNQLQLSENYLKNNEKLSEISAKNSEISKLISEFELQINENKSKKEILEKYIEELKIRKERQQLEAKYSEDRKKLILGEECFLCGSKEHPFVKSYENLLDKTSKTLKLKEEELKNLENENQIFIKKLTENQSILKTNNQKNAELNLEINKINAKFSENNQQTENKLNIDNQDLIKSEINKTIEEGKNIKNQIEILTKLSDLQNEINNSENISEKISNICKKEKSVLEILVTYEKYSKSTRDFNKIIEIFNSELKKYTSVKEHIINLTKSISTSENLVKEKTEVLEKLKNELIEQKADLEKIKTEIEKTKTERHEQLGTNLPDDIENQQRNAIKLNSVKITESEKNITKLSADKQNTEISIQQLNFENVNIFNLIHEKENYLLPKLSAEGYKNIDEALKFLLSETEVEKIKKQQTNLHDKKTSVQQSLKDINEELISQENLDDKSITYHETEIKIEELKSEIENKNREIGMIKNKLEDNKIKAKENENLKEQFIHQEKEFERWNALNDLIGDATGKKFTLYAQQITLSQLINLANEHLKNLSDRYILKKSEHSMKENLIVIDTYMAHSERSVQTLSGGESFLLSLALALGLSDLASKNTKIESLFIDEGFGTLDQHTLDVALSTLEDLQSQTNRSIGIISHVQAIKERITTQIELVKLNSGYSSIEIR